MMKKLRFGAIVLQDTSWDEQVSRWQQAEKMGFDNLWIADHFVNYMAPSDPWFESWTLLAAMAANTKSIRIGTLVTAIPWRNPAFLAKQALTVDHISNGRLELGMGAGTPGHIEPGYKMTGIADWPPAERVERFREVVQIVDQLLQNSVSSYDGQYYNLKDTAMSPASIQKPRPPITIGALGPKMLKITAQYADTWNTFGGHSGTVDEIFEDVRQGNDKLNQYCQEIERDPTTLRRSLLLFGSVAEACYGSSLDAFYEIIGKYQEIGFSDFILYYPFMDAHMPAFERIVWEGIPTLKGERPKLFNKIKTAYRSYSSMGRKMTGGGGVKILSDVPKFDGPFTSIDELNSQSGICAVMVLSDKVRQSFGLIDVVEAEDIKAQMQSHERESYWQEKAQGEVLFSVHYAPEFERKELMGRIEEKFKLSRA
jgi:alkanesulfonate monooxygenase SsuD/methylene tetrahydromethanopterin reductase-like flavin-dependent oxidoreductase (luciferase family)